MSRRDLPALIGVIHLPPLPGAPSAPDSAPSDLLRAAGYAAIREAQIFSQSGFDGIILENFGDTPFYKDQVPTETIVSLSVIAAAVREVTRLPLGLNVLRNDAQSALTIATLSGFQFIRVNVLNGVAATDQGLVEGNAAQLLRERKRLGSQVRILADVHVKHARSLSSDDIGLAVEETALRAKADGVIVSGATTGRLIEQSELERASRSARQHGVSLWIGSGAALDSLPMLAELADGVIVSSALRKGSRAGAALDPKKAKTFAKEFKKQAKLKRR